MKCTYPVESDSTGVIPKKKGGEYKMKKFAKGAAAAVAAASILLNTALPVLAGTTLEISGNGSDTTNKAYVDVDQTTSVDQSNTANIENNVHASADSGKNDANRNTGGSVLVDTGNASTTVGVTNTVNNNVAEVACCEGDVDVLISENGDDSYNKVDLDVNQSRDSGTWVTQTNRADIDNDVYADSNTGKNDANRNTGGTVSIDTGNAKVDVAVDNMVNFNWADVDCGCILDVLAKIVDNGDSSKNEVKADIEDLLGVVQDNSCDKYGYGERSWWWKHHKKPCLDNEVYADADTGKNDVDRNTGDPGVDPSIETGNAETDVVVENSGNSNVFGETAPDWGWEPPFPGMSFNINLTFSLGDLLAALLG